MQDIREKRNNKRKKKPGRRDCAAYRTPTTRLLFFFDFVVHAKPRDAWAAKQRRLAYRRRSLARELSSKTQIYAADVRANIIAESLHKRSVDDKGRKQCVTRVIFFAPRITIKAALEQCQPAKKSATFSLSHTFSWCSRPRALVEKHHSRLSRFNTHVGDDTTYIDHKHAGSRRHERS